MSGIRIYSLAKQLNIDSKDVLELCVRAGLGSKMSPLAVLPEDDAERVRALHVQGSAKGAVPSAARPERPARETVARGKVPKVPTLATTKPRPIAEHVTAEPQPPDMPIESDAPAVPEPTPEPLPVVPAVPTVESVAEPAEVVATDAPPVVSPVVSPIDSGAARRPSPLGRHMKPKEDDTPEALAPPSVPVLPAGPVSTGQADSDYMRRMQQPGYRGPMRTLGRVPTVGTSGGSSGSTSGGTAPPRSGTGRAPLGSLLAKMPPSSTPRQRPAATEPTPQKPTIKLSPSDIRGVHSGATTIEALQKQGAKPAGSAGKEPPKKDNDRAKVAPSATDDASKKKGVRRTAADETDDAASRRLGVRRGVPGVGAKGAADTRGVGANTRGRQARGGGRRKDEYDQDGSTYRQLRRKRGSNSVTTEPRKDDIVLQLPCTIKDFAQITGLPIARVMKKLLELGLPVTSMTATLNEETALLLVEDLGLRVVVRDQVTLEDQIVAECFEDDDPASPSLCPRPPVVTFLGHVDHGKTSLLDKILHLDVVSGEKGGITQHIRAYRVTTPRGDIAFVDTPGHEAFTEMRARGANCTDIAVIVVAADDGVMPQTEEAISHARAAGVPIVVALNKIDLPSVNIDRVMQGLATNDLLPSEWGGDVEVVKCSALTGEGIDNLLEMLVTIAELREFKANPDRPAVGMALEAEMRAGQGVVAKVLVQNGTLRVGDVVLCGTAHGRVRSMLDTLDSSRTIEVATPGTPVQLFGLDMAPSAGSRFCVVDDISDARRVAEHRAKESRREELIERQPRVTLENLFQRIDGSVSILNLIIRADVRGSIEAIKKELGKLDHPEVQIRILQATVGGITEGDVQLADASDAIIVGFNVVPDEKARSLADARKIQVRRYDIIYKLTDDIRAALEGMLKPLSQVKELGRALVQQVFSISRLGNIAGCRVLAGTIERDGKARIIRESRIIGEYRIDSLKREKNDTKEVREGYECGIKLKGFNDLKEGDILEVYKVEEVARKL